MARKAEAEISAKIRQAAVSERRSSLYLFMMKKFDTIADAVDFLIHASTNLDLMKQYASEPQSFSIFSAKKPPAWLEFWAARHPGEPWSALLTQPLSDSTIGGSATLYVAPAK